MYTIKINNDNTAIVTQKQRIMQRSKLVDTLQFIVDKTYNGIEMSKYSVLMKWITPISKTLRIATLVLSDNNYKEDYLLFVLPENIDTDMTAENGDLKIQITIMCTDMEDEGEVKEHVREIDEITIPIVPVSNWFVAPDEALDTLTQYFLANQKQIKALDDLINTFNTQKADDIKLDIEAGEIYLVANGKRIGTGIKVEDLGNEITEKTSSGTFMIH